MFFAYIGFLIQPIVTFNVIENNYRNSLVKKKLFQTKHENKHLDFLESLNYTDMLTSFLKTIHYLPLIALFLQVR